MEYFDDPTLPLTPVGSKKQKTCNNADIQTPPK